MFELILDQNILIQNCLADTRKILDIRTDEQINDNQGGVRPLERGNFFKLYAFILLTSTLVCYTLKCVMLTF